MERVAIEAVGALAFFVAGGLLWPKVKQLFWSEEHKLAVKMAAEEAKLRSKL